MIKGNGSILQHLHGYPCTIHTKINIGQRSKHLYTISNSEVTLSEEHVLRALTISTAATLALFRRFRVGVTPRWSYDPRNKRPL